LISGINFEINKGYKNMKAGRTERRQGALSRLEEQLKSGKKPEKVNKKSTGKMVELGDKDKTRITNEIGVLKQRVV
jgi:hypothetical protein